MDTCGLYISGKEIGVNMFISISESANKERGL